MTPDVSKLENSKQQNIEKFPLHHNHDMRKDDNPAVGLATVGNLRSVNGHASFMQESGVNVLENMFCSPHSDFCEISHAEACQSDSETECTSNRRYEN